MVKSCKANTIVKRGPLRLFAMRTKSVIIPAGTIGVVQTDFNCVNGEYVEVLFSGYESVGPLLNNHHHLEVIERPESPTKTGREKIKW